MAVVVPKIPQAHLTSIGLDEIDALRITNPVYTLTNAYVLIGEMASLGYKEMALWFKYVKGSEDAVLLNCRGYLPIPDKEFDLTYQWEFGTSEFLPRLSIFRIGATGSAHVNLTTKVVPIVRVYAKMVGLLQNAPGNVDLYAAWGNSR